MKLPAPVSIDVEYAVGVTWLVTSGGMYTSVTVATVKGVGHDAGAVYTTGSTYTVNGSTLVFMLKLVTISLSGTDPAGR